MENLSENLPVARELFDCPCGSKYIKTNKHNHNKTKKHQRYLEGIQGEAVSVIASSEDFTEEEEEEERDYDDVESTIDIKKIMYSIVQKSIEDMIHVYLTDFFENLA